MLLLCFVWLRWQTPTPDPQVTASKHAIESRGMRQIPGGGVGERGFLKPERPSSCLLSYPVHTAASAREYRSPRGPARQEGAAALPQRRPQQPLPAPFPSRGHGGPCSRSGRLPQLLAALPAGCWGSVLPPDPGRCLPNTPLQTLRQHLFEWHTDGVARVLFHLNIVLQQLLSGCSQSQANFECGLQC